ncbi:MAG: hypothetical protein QXG35_08385 [Nitrososphaerota archaeon]
MKKDAKEILEKYAAKNKVSISALVGAIARSIPDVPLETLTKVMRTPTIWVRTEMEAEEAKICTAKLYAIITSLKHILLSLFPEPPYFHIGSTGILKPWALDKYTALRAANVISSGVDVFSLLADLENAANALSRILTRIWVNWEKEFHPPLLPREFYLPNELLKHEAAVLEGWREAVQRETSRMREKIAEIICEAEELAEKIQAGFILELLRKYRNLFFVYSPEGSLIGQRP